MEHGTSPSAYQGAVMTLPLTPPVNGTRPTPTAPLQTGGSLSIPTMADAGPNLQGTVSSSLWVLLILATTLVALRMYCKYLRYRSYTLDDGLLVASWAVFLASIVIGLVLVGRGQGKHIWEIPPEDLPTFALPGRITTTLQVVALAWSKTSFAVTLLAVVPQKFAKWFLCFAIVTLNMALGVSAMLPWISCVPLQKSWKPEIPGVCNFPPVRVATIFTIFAGAYSGFLDVAFVCLAWKTVLIVQMELREKAAVGLAMSMGVFAAVCAIIKCTHLSVLPSPDFTYELSPIIIWSAAEASATIMAACVPSLRVLARTASSNAKNRFFRRDRRRDAVYSLQGGVNKAPAQASTVSASLASMRPELKSQLSLEKWALGENDYGKEESLVSGNAIHVDTVVHMEWEPVRHGKRLCEESYAAESAPEGGRANYGQGNKKTTVEPSVRAPGSH